HPGFFGDAEDPRKRGILRNISCRTYREKLRSTQQAHILQGLMLITIAATVLVVLWFHSMELKLVDQTIDSLQALWLGSLGILGLGSRRPGAATGAGSATTGSLYCSQQLDTTHMFRQIGRQVLNQELALARLERVVRSQRNFKSVALLGPPGVGKSLTAMSLRQQFPWSENVHSYSWSTYVPDGAHKFHMMRSFVEGLSDCGQNLLIVDNLSTCDYGIVPIYNKLLLEREGDLSEESSAAVNQTVLVVYIFNLEMEYYWEQFELLQQLPVDTTIINYRPFGREELSDCLEHELRLEQRHLDQSVIAQILEEALLDVQYFGCKRLRQLIYQHGLFT
ncbi:hypothetical protein KR222_008848, partial [Zaprionus bogoriensis]